MSLPLDVGNVVDEFNVGPLTIERRSDPIQNAFGGFDAGPPIVFEIEPVAAHVASGRDLDQVPEADRNSEIVQFYARDISFPAGVDVGFRVADDGFAPDVVLYQGRRYRFTTSQDYSRNGAVWCGLATLEDRQAIP